MENKTSQNTINPSVITNSLTLKTFILLVAATAFWGSGFPLSKVVMASVSPDVAAFFRFGMGSLIMIVFLSMKKKRNRSIDRGNWLLVILVGFAGVTIFNLFLFIGLDFAYASDGSIIIPILSPILTVILASLFLKEKLTKVQILGMFVALIGTILFFSVVFNGSQINLDRLYGVLLFIGAALFWAIYTILGKRLYQTVDPLPATAYGMFFGAIIIGVFAFPNLLNTNWSQLDFSFWAINIYLAIFPTVLAYFFYNNGVKEIGSGKASVFMFLVPISGLIVSMIVLYEIPTAFQVFGAMVMIIGVYIVNVQKIPLWSRVSGMKS